MYWHLSSQSSIAEKRNTHSVNRKFKDSWTRKEKFWGKNNKIIHLLYFQTGNFHHSEKQTQDLKITGRFSLLHSPPQQTLFYWGREFCDKQKEILHRK